MDLRTHLAEYIRLVDKEHILKDEIIYNMSISLKHFILHATTKFVAGQKEHGGDIRERPLMEEMASEMVDQFWYGPFGAMSWPPKAKDQ